MGLESVVVRGHSVPRHPSFDASALPERVRLTGILQSIQWARKHCTSRERPLYAAICAAELRCLTMLSDLGGTPSPVSEPTIWESELSEL